MKLGDLRVSVAPARTRFSERFASVCFSRADRSVRTLRVPETLAGDFWKFWPLPLAPGKTVYSARSYEFRSLELAFERSLRREDAFDEVLGDVGGRRRSGSS